LGLKPVEDLKSSFIDKKFYVLYVKQNPDKYSRLLLNKPIKDSLLQSPPNGWENIPAETR